MSHSNPVHHNHTVYPTNGGLNDSKFKYRFSYETDIRKTFTRIRKIQKEQAAARYVQSKQCNESD